MTPSAVISGRRADLLAPLGDMVLAADFGTSQICGPTSADFSLLLGARTRPAWITKGAPASVDIGGELLLSGEVSEVDWTDGSITITGASADGDQAECIDGSDNTSSTLDTIIDAAIARGAVSWSRPASIDSTAFAAGDSTSTPNYIGDLAAEWSTAAARPVVDADRVIRKTADPATPALFAMPGAGELSWATSTEATRLIGYWQDSFGTPGTTRVGSGKKERIIDLRPLGAINSTRATSVLAEILADLASGGWTGGLTLAAEQLYGAPSLAKVFAMCARGAMLRNFAQYDPRPGIATPYVDVIIERAEWHVADRQIILTPRGMVARDFASVLAQYGVSEAS